MECIFLLVSPKNYEHLKAVDKTLYMIVAIFYIFSPINIMEFFSCSANAFNIPFLEFS